MRLRAKASASSAFFSQDFAALPISSARHAQAGAGKVDAIEPLAQFDQRRVAALDHVIDDRARGGVHVGGDFALRREERVELLAKVSGGGIKAKRHRSRPCECDLHATSMTRRAASVNSLIAKAKICHDTVVSARGET